MVSYLIFLYLFLFLNFLFNYVAILLVGPVGDNDSFSCSFSPANSPFALITSATIREFDYDRPGTNYGDCVDVNAPRDMILSPSIGSSNIEESYLSGSSASSAVITGMLGVIITVLKFKITFSNSSRIYKYS